MSPLTESSTAFSPQQQALLQQLADIALPEEPSFWPLSTPLIAILIAVFFLLGMTIYYGLRHRRRAAARRYAIEELKNFQDMQSTSSHSVQYVNQLLKQLCFTLNPLSRHALAPLWGEAFYQNLGQYLKLPQRKIAENDYSKEYVLWEKLHYGPTHDINDHALSKFFAYAKLCIHTMSDTRYKRTPRSHKLISRATEK